MKNKVYMRLNMSETLSLSGLGMGLVRSFSGRGPVMVMFLTRCTPDNGVWCIVNCYCLLQALGVMPTSRAKTREKTMGEANPDCSAMSLICISGCSRINRFASSIR